jgi:hypothetical protein
LTNLRERLNLNFMPFSAKDGWITLPGPDGGGGGLHVATHQRDGRLVITEVYIHADEITPEIMRNFSVSRLEAELNAALPTGQTPEMVTSALEKLGLIRRDDSPEPSLADLRDQARRVGAARQTRSRRAPAQRPRLTRPAGTEPNVFYSHVAAAYSEYAPRTRKAAKEMAAEASVPVTTAHRWIREARRRGYLPPARKGKAG